MLDFYLIADEQAKYTSPQGLQFVGSIEEQEFTSAKQAGLIVHHADYYGDSRWFSAQVKQKIAMFNSTSSTIAPNLLSILCQAENTSKGVVAFGD